MINECHGAATSRRVTTKLTCKFETKSRCCTGANSVTKTSVGRSSNYLFAVQLVTELVRPHHAPT